MKICSLEELNKIPFTVDGISAIRQSPSYRSLEIDGRIYNGLMLVEVGSCVYEWGNERVELKEGACIYLPLGSHHRMVEHSDEFSMIRVNFAVSAPDGDAILFSLEPMVLCSEPDRILMLTVNRMAELFTTADHLFLKKACFYELLDRMVRLQFHDRQNPIQ